MPGFWERARVAIDILRNDYAAIGTPVRDDSSGRSSRPGSIHRDPSSAIIAPILNRIALDVSNLAIRHVALNEDERFESVVHSGLNYCLSVEPNIDQTPRTFTHDIVLTMLHDGHVAIVPTRTSANPKVTQAYDILELRAGEVQEMFASELTVNVYNDRTGTRVDKLLPKRFVAFCHNPLFEVMNAPNATLSRLREKLYLLDVVDKQSGSGRLDLLLQLPFAIKGEKRMAEAQERLNMLEAQLENTRFGIGYVGSTEKITQLNRSVENKLLEQVNLLTSMLYTQLGLTPAVFDGTASQEEVVHYNNVTVYPIATEIVQSMRTSFLTKTAITQRKTITYFPHIFKMATLENLSEAVDKFTRNEVMSSNEFRGILMLRPSSQPSADELRNKNVAKPKEDTSPLPDPKEALRDEKNTTAK